MPIPWLNVQQPYEPTPLESFDESESTGLAANFKANFYGSLGASLIAQGIGAFEGGPSVPHDEAVRQFKANGYDVGVLPSGDVTKGTMAALMNQQDKIQSNQDLARRAHLGGVSEFLTSMAGSLSDPIFLALAPVAGEAEALMGLRGLSLAGRAAKGAVVGGGIMGWYTLGERVLGTAPGDEDISTGDILRQTALGALLAAPAEMAFGARPRPKLPDLQDTAKVSVLQTMQDSPVNVEPILDRQAVTPAGSVRFYHGAVSAETLTTGGPRWLTPDPNYARDFRAGPEGKQVFYVDIPEDHPALDRAKAVSDEDVRAGVKQFYQSFEAPEDIAKQLKPFPMARRVVQTDMSEAVPKPDAIFTQDPAVQAASAKLTEITPQPVSAETAALQEQTTQAIADAQHAEGVVEPQGTPFTTEMKDANESIANEDVLAKAITAAVQCGALKGLG